MAYNKFNYHPDSHWMKDSEKNRLADMLTSKLQKYSDDWKLQDSCKAVDIFEKWLSGLIDTNRFVCNAIHGDDLTFTFHVTQNIHSDELFDTIQEFYPEEWHYIRETMLIDPVVEITYEDRYINTPLGCILLVQFIRRICDLYMLNIRNLRICLSKKDFRVLFDDEDLKLDHRFSFCDSRDHFLEKCVRQILKCKFDYQLKNVGHARVLRIFNKKYILSIIPDGGIAHGWGIENGKHSSLTTKDISENLDINLVCFNRNAHRHDKSGICYTVHFELLK